MKIGYARVSSTGQSLDVQLEQLTAAGCEKIYQEKRSGRTTIAREQLERALDQVRAGDVLVVTRLDRLARSVPDLYAIVRDLEESGVAFQCLQQGAIDTSTSTGKLMFGVLGAVAEFENDLRKERQREGIERAKAAGVYRGRKPSYDADQVLEAIKDKLAAGEAPYSLVAELGISRTHLYRIAAKAGGLAQLAEEAKAEQPAPVAELEPIA